MEDTVPNRITMRCVHDKALYKSTFTFTFTMADRSWSCMPTV